MAPKSVARSTKNTVKVVSMSAGKSITPTLAETRKKNKQLKKKLEKALTDADTVRQREMYACEYLERDLDSNIDLVRLQKEEKRERLEEAEAQLAHARKAHEEIKKKNVEKENTMAQLRREARALESNQGVKTVIAQKKKVAKLRKQMLSARDTLRKCQEEKSGEPASWRLCGICTVEYTKTAKHCPRVLDCGHVLCATCIKTMIENGKLVCPFDRQVIQVTKETVNKLPMDCLILQI